MSVMRVYWDIVRFNFLRFLTYPIEIWATVLKRLIFTGFLILFWIIVSQSSDGTLQARPLIAYFLISGGINDLIAGQSLRFARFLSYAIKNGGINSYLIRPVQIVPYLYASNLGEEGLTIILGALTVIIGIFLSPPTTFLNVIFLLLFLIFAVAISFACNLLVGTFSFYTPEASSFRYAAGHIIRVLSGAMVPLTFFPTTFRSIAMATPFAAMIYAPTNALQTSSFTSDFWHQLVISLIWAIVLPIYALWRWNTSLRNYDAVGI